MSILLTFARASTLADLPLVARQYFNDDEDFIETCAGKDDYEKCEQIAMCLFNCLSHKGITDTEIARMTALTIVGLDHLYDEKKAEDDTEEVAEITIPVMAAAPVVAPAPVVVPAEPKKKPGPKPRVKLDPDAPKRGRGRPPKNPEANGFKCAMCNICFASSGSLHNHYHSKPHKTILLDIIDRATNFMTDDKTYKVVVETRNKAAGKELGLTQENPDEGTFADLKEYVENGENPIAYLSLCVGIDRQYPSGRPYISWNKVL